MGGNVFKNQDKQSVTQRIKQTDIPSTVQWIEKLTGLEFPRERWLGSTGKTTDSGDIDLAVDANEISKEELFARLVSWAEGHNFKPAEYVRKGNEIHLKTPINGNPQFGYVQTDFMFFPNLDWGSFYYQGGEDSSYRGMIRNVLLSSIAKPLGLKVGSNGAISRHTGEVVSNNPDQVAEWLLGKGHDHKDLKNVETIYSNLTGSDKDEKLKDFREYLNTQGLSEPDIVTENNDANFLARLRDRIVNQGMVPIMEAEVVQGGSAKGIEHIEDLVFRRGSAGIQQAIETILHLKDNTRKSATVKWDGTPAVIWGRLPDGQFMLTDVAGFSAVGYDGHFTSLQQLIRQLARRDDDSLSKGRVANRLEKLAPIYEELWPMLEAATPEDFKGFIQGDLLYTQRPKEDSGNLVFKPNTVVYRIPAASELGQDILQSDIGIAMHTRYKSVDGDKAPLGKVKLHPVPGLLLIEPVRPKENVEPSSPHNVKEIMKLLRKHGSKIDLLFSPTELRAQKITDLPKLCVEFINSLIKDDTVHEFNEDQLVPDFLEWLKNRVTPSKFRNILEYLQSPRSNFDAMSSAFAAFVLLHDVKMDLLQQLDRQHPGQEGWVIVSPSGTTKFVNRFGFSRANSKK